MEKTTIWIVAGVVFLVLAAIFVVMYALLPSGGAGDGEFLETRKNHTHVEREHHRGTHRPNYFFTGVVILIFAFLGVLFVFRCQGKKFK